jgi:hypothetical protein
MNICGRPPCACAHYAAATSAGLRRAVGPHREAARQAAGAAGRGVVLNNLVGTLRAWARATDDQQALREVVRVPGGAALCRAAERAGVLTNL